METIPHEISPERSALSLNGDQCNEAIESGADFIPQTNSPFDLPPAALSLYNLVLQEVEIGVQTLQRESADIAVTMFQSALQKLTVDQPLYDQLVHNLLAGYRLLIEQLLR